MADQSTTPSTETASSGILDDYVLKQVSIRAAIVVGHSCLPENLTDDVSQDMIVELLKAQRRFDPARASKPIHGNQCVLTQPGRRRGVPCL